MTGSISCVARGPRTERRSGALSPASLTACNDEFVVPSRRHDDPARFVGYRNHLAEPVIALLADNTKNQYSQRKAIWNWLYQHNPFIGDKELGFALVGQNRVVGYNGFIPIHLLRDGELICSAWSFDTILLPEARGRGYGGKFVDLVKSSYPIVLGYGIGDLQAKIMLNRGYRASAEIERFFYSNSPRTVREWGKCGLQLSKRLTRSHQRVEVSNLSIDIGSARHLPSEIDRLWDSVKSSHKNIVVRDSAYMQWRYAMHPVKDYSTLVVRENNVLRALAIFEQTKKCANLVDYLGGANDREAMQLIVETFIMTSSSSHLLACTCTNACLKSALGINGFRRYRDRPKFYVYSNLDNDQDWTSSWFVMDGDSDVNYY